MKYAVGMASCGMIYVANLMKTGSGVQKLIGGIHRQQGDPISLLYFFENKKVG
jgi:hypothetical protein